jgi:hypothetical protein
MLFFPFLMVTGSCGFDLLSRSIPLKRLPRVGSLSYFLRFPHLIHHLLHVRLLDLGLLLPIYRRPTRPDLFKWHLFGFACIWPLLPVRNCRLLVGASLIVHYPELLAGGLVQELHQVDPAL